VLEVPVIKTQSRIEQNALNAVPGSDFNLTGKVIAHERDRIGAEIEVSDLADIPALDITDDHRRVMRRHEAKQFVAPLRAGKVQEVGPGFETCPGYFGLITFDRH